MSDFIDIGDLGLEDEDLKPTGEAGGMKEPPAEAPYILEVTGCETSVSQTSGGRSIVFTSAVVSNADGSATEEAGKDFKQWFSLSSKDYPRRRLKNMLNALGLSLAGFSTEEAMGKRYYAEVYHESYEKPTADGDVREYINARTRREQPVAA